MLRRLPAIVLAGALLIAALSTGSEPLFFLLYLSIIVVGGSYVLTRFGLVDLEVGYVLDRQHAEVGDTLRATYTVRNTGRLPKPWLEVYGRSTLPVPLPGRALALGPRSERAWMVHVPLTRRGHYRVEPLSIRTGDPFGLFESVAQVGQPATVIVYPRVELLPGWRLPPAALVGSHSNPERTLQTTPHVTSIRPYAPGDAYNRIHWPSSARHGDLQVKEFDLEQTADVWLFLDLESSAQAGSGDESTLEYGVRAAASMAARALSENRSVGMTAGGGGMLILPSDRGARQYQKVMQLLAAVQADGRRPFRDVLVESIGRLRRGMTAIVISPSTDRSWIRPLVALRGRGVKVVLTLLEGEAFDEQHRRMRRLPPLEATELEARRRAQRAMLHEVAEQDLDHVTLGPARPLAEQLVTAGRSNVVVAR
jgi:uncharacterized protein (DUF58 family)